jgi:hypothetical protein
MRILRYLALSSLFLTTTANASDIKLKFIDDLNIESGTPFKGTTLGGLSALVYDHVNDELVALSDDRGERGEGELFASRIYRFKLSFEGGEFIATPVSVKPLRLNADQFFPPKFLDPEGIALMPNGEVFVSSEGFEDDLSSEGPSVLYFNQDLIYQDRLDIPSHYTPSSPEATDGIGRNLGFESLALTPDAAVLYTASEAYLNQDEPVVIRENKSFTRILSFKNDLGSYKPFQELLYPLSTYMAFNDQGNPVEYACGLADFVAIDGTTLYTLERGFDGEKNIIRIFQTELEGADDVSQLDTITSTEGLAMASKELVLDLNDIVSQLDPNPNPNAHKLDNIEGIAIGPKLPNGNSTLILVSDDNWNKYRNQRTLFLLFEIEPKN